MLCWGFRLLISGKTFGSKIRGKRHCVTRGFLFTRMLTYSALQPSAVEKSFAMKRATQLLAAPLLAAGVLGQFVPAPTDLITKEGYANVSVRYKQVPPGICELNPKVKSYSGYADVGENQHIFWWFFEARNQDPKDAPLTVSLFGIHALSPGLTLYPTDLDQWRTWVEFHDWVVSGTGTLWCGTRYEAVRQPVLVVER